MDNCVIEPATGTWIIVGVSVAVVLVAILAFRLHAFLTLLLAGMLVAVLSAVGTLSSVGTFSAVGTFSSVGTFSAVGTSGSAPIETYTRYQIERCKMSESDTKSLIAASPPSRLASEFGLTAGKIGILIALASVVGGCLLESKTASVIFLLDDPASPIVARPRGQRLRAVHSGDPGRRFDRTQSCSADTGTAVGRRDRWRRHRHNDDRGTVDWFLQQHRVAVRGASDQPIQRRAASRDRGWGRRRRSHFARTGQRLRTGRRF